MNNQDRTMFYILGKNAGTFAFRAEPYDEQIEEAIEWLAIANRSERRPLMLSFYEGLRNYCTYQHLYDLVRNDLETRWKEHYCRHEHLHDSLDESSHT